MIIKHIKTASALASLVAGAAFIANFEGRSGTSEHFLRTSFSSALNSQQVAEAAPADGRPEPGSEAFWLASPAPGIGSLVAKAVSVGDRITLKFGDEERQLEVSTVAEMAPGLANTSTRPDNRLYLVTARDPGVASSADFRFMIEVPKINGRVVSQQPGRSL